MKKPGIPGVPTTAGSLASILQALKINVESLTGVRGGRIELLANDADLPTAVAKINEIIRRLNAVE